MNTISEIYSLLNKLIDNNTPIIVEGKKDKAALKALGAKNIITLCPTYQLVESLSQEKEVAILVDLDSEGRKIYHKLKDEFSRRGIKVNDKLRLFLFKNTKLRQIEGLTKYLIKMD